MHTLVARTRFWRRIGAALAATYELVLPQWLLRHPRSSKSSSSHQHSQHSQSQAPAAPQAPQQDQPPPPPPPLNRTLLGWGFISQPSLMDGSNSSDVVSSVVLLHLNSSPTSLDLSRVLVDGTWQIVTVHQPDGAAGLLRNMSTAEQKEAAAEKKKAKAENAAKQKAVAEKKKAAAENALVRSSSARAQQVEAPSPQDARRFEEALERRRLRVKPVAGDGNCMFRSIADQIYGDEEMHAVTRELCMDHMEQSRAHFEQFIANEEFSDYIARKRRDVCTRLIH